MKNDRLYLLHICECIDKIERYTREGEVAFFKDDKTQDAVIRNLQVLAESSQRLSSALKEAHQEIEWRKIAGFRNILVHQYLGVNIALIWRIATDHLPDLKQKLTAVLEGMA